MRTATQAGREVTREDTGTAPAGRRMGTSYASPADARALDVRRPVGASHFARMARAARGTNASMVQPPQRKRKLASLQSADLDEPANHRREPGGVPEQDAGQRQTPSSVETVDCRQTGRSLGDEPLSSGNGHTDASAARAAHRVLTLDVASDRVGPEQDRSPGLSHIELRLIGEVRGGRRRSAPVAHPPRGAGRPRSAVTTEEFELLCNDAALRSIAGRAGCRVERPTQSAHLGMERRGAHLASELHVDLPVDSGPTAAPQVGIGRDRGSCAPPRPYGLRCGRLGFRDERVCSTVGQESPEAGRPTQPKQTRGTC